MRTKLQGEEGQNLVELALVMLLLLALLAGAVDVGRAFNNYIIITNASREGARIAARLPCKASGAGANLAALTTAIKNAAISEASNSGITLATGDITITPNTATTCPTAGGVIRVTVDYDFTPVLTDAIGIAPFNMSNFTEMLWYGVD